jgi:hypothetical protein
LVILRETVDLRHTKSRPDGYRSTQESDGLSCEIHRQQNTHSESLKAFEARDLGRPDPIYDPDGENEQTSIALANGTQVMNVLHKGSSMFQLNSMSHLELAGHIKTVPHLRL